MIDTKQIEAHRPASLGRARNACIRMAIWLVGIGDFGEQLLALCVELRGGAATMERGGIEPELRHIARIGREKLAVWAAEQRH